MTAGDRIDLDPGPLCLPPGVIQPEDQLEDDGGALACLIIRRDRFHSPVIPRLSNLDPVPYRLGPIFFTFDEDDKITSVRLGRSAFPGGANGPVAGVISDVQQFTEGEAGEAARPFTSYRTEFMDWLRAAHPDVATRFGPGVVGALPTARDMTIALEYIAEFVDDIYPEAEITAAMEADHQSHVATIEAMLEAYNRNDAEEWLSFFPDGIDLDDTSGLSIEHEQAFMAANGRWTLAAECVAVMQGSYPFYAAVLGPEVTGNVSARVFHCPTMRADDFYGAGGITGQVPFDFIFDGAGRLTGYATTGDAGWIERYGDWFDPHADFARDFLTWLQATHPDAAAEFDSDGLITARDMPASLEYVDEFVAQSDTYPL